MPQSHRHCSQLVQDFRSQRQGRCDPGSGCHATTGRAESNRRQGAESLRQNRCLDQRSWLHTRGCNRRSNVSHSKRRITSHTAITNSKQPARDFRQLQRERFRGGEFDPGRAPAQASSTQAPVSRLRTISRTTTRPPWGRSELRLTRPTTTNWGTLNWAAKSVWMS